MHQKLFAKAIANALHSHSLLIDDPITEAQWQMLLAMFTDGSFFTLTSLELTQGMVDNSHVTSLAAALKCVPRLTRLHLGINSAGIDDAGATSLAAALKFVPQLTELYLGGNNIDAVGAASLAASLRYLPQLMTLSLGGNKIGAVGAVSLAASLHYVPQLTKLYLAGNNIGAVGAASLAAALMSLPLLNEVDLVHNYINSTFKNLVVDAAAMKLGAIITLDMQSHEIAAIRKMINGLVNKADTRQAFSGPEEILNAARYAAGIGLRLYEHHANTSASVKVTIKGGEFTAMLQLPPCIGIQTLRARECNQRIQAQQYHGVLRASLRELDVSGLDIRGHLLPLLAATLRCNPDLEWLNLQGNPDINDILPELLKMHNLVGLTLSELDGQSIHWNNHNLLVSNTPALQELCARNQEAVMKAIAQLLSASNIENPSIITQQATAIRAVVTGERQELMHLWNGSSHDKARALRRLESTVNAPIFTPTVVPMSTTLLSPAAPPTNPQCSWASKVAVGALTVAMGAAAIAYGNNR
jgi:Leucine-rich repeat (LRR) protein